MRTMVLGVAALLVVTIAGMAQTAAPAAPASVAGTQTKLPFTISKETTAITDPLRPDGTPDYVAASNEKYGKGVTPENNGFVELLSALGTDVLDAKTRPAILNLCGAKPMPGTWTEFDTYVSAQRGLDADSRQAALDAWTDARESLWLAKDRPILAAYLAAQDKPLALVTDAVAKPRWWIPSVGNSMLAATLPSRGFLREVGDALCARATLRACSGDFEGFLADALAVKRLARQVGSGATLLDQLAGEAIEEHANHALGAAIGAGIFSESQCQSLRKQLADLRPMTPIAEAVNCCERWALLESIIKMSLSSGRQPFALPGDSLENALSQLNTIEPNKVDFDVVLKQLNAEYDAYVQALRLPTWKDQNASLLEVEARIQGWAHDWHQKNGGMLSMDAAETSEAYSQRVGKAILTIIIPSLIKESALACRCRMTADMQQALLAAAEVKARTGKWPTTLQELAPGILKGVPQDMYSKDGATVKYLVNEGGARIYSIGNNQKDDGGVNDRANDKDDVVVGAK